MPNAKKARKGGIAKTTWRTVSAWARHPTRMMQLRRTVRISRLKRKIERVRGVMRG